MSILAVKTYKGIVKELIADSGGRLFVIDPLITFTDYPFGKGPLTSTGAQYCTELTTTTANVNNDVGLVTVGKYMPPGTIVALEFALTASFAAASSATADLIYQWAAKDISASSWVNLHAAVTLTDTTTTDKEYTYSGRFAIIDSDGRMNGDLLRVPFKCKLMIQCNEANEGQAKTKNSSYIKVTYLPD